MTVSDALSVLSVRIIVRPTLRMASTCPRPPHLSRTTLKYEPRSSRDTTWRCSYHDAAHRGTGARTRTWCIMSRTSARVRKSTESTIVPTTPYFFRVWLPNTPRHAGPVWSAHRTVTAAGSKCSRAWSSSCISPSAASAPAPASAPPQVLHVSTRRAHLSCRQTARIAQLAGGERQRRAGALAASRPALRVSLSANTATTASPKLLTTAPRCLSTTERHTRHNSSRRPSSAPSALACVWLAACPSCFAMRSSSAPILQNTRSQADDEGCRSRQECSVQAADRSARRKHTHTRRNAQSMEHRLWLWGGAGPVF
eukprot:2857557-Rhodomonas_salina.2